MNLSIRQNEFFIKPFEKNEYLSQNSLNYRKEEQTGREYPAAATRIEHLSAVRIF
jgi:hypothetical protein